MRRFEAYSSALDVLEKASEQDLDNEFVQSGIINKFSLQFELAWKTLKDLLRYEGDATAPSGSPRDIMKAAYRYFDFVDEEIWLSMLRDRNNIVHVYDAEEAKQLVTTIIATYIPTFVGLRAAIQRRYGEVLEHIA